MNKSSITKIFLFFLIVGVEHINASSNNLRKRKATTTATSFIESISGLFMKEDWSCCDGTNEPTPVPTVNVDVPTSSSSPTLRPTSIPTTSPTYAQKKITASDGTEYDSFGSSCSMSGDLIVIGAYHAGDNSEGAAYLFHLDGNEIKKLIPSDNSTKNYFGYSVSVDKKVVVGTGVVTGYHYVQVFSLEGEYERTITCDDCHYFGYNVGTLGDRIVISGYENSSDKLFIYTTGGELLEKIDTNSNDSIRHVDISDEVIVFTTGLKTYVYSNSAPYFEEIVEIPQGGYVVATSGDRVVIGDYSTNTVWLYETNGTFIKTLEEDSERFGSSVDITDDKIIVGADFDNEVADQAGSVFVYSSDGDLQEKVLPPNGQAYNYFGDCVSASDSYFVVGAPGDDDNGLSSGATYLY